MASSSIQFTVMTSPTIINELCFVIKLAKSISAGRMCNVPVNTKTYNQERWREREKNIYAHQLNASTTFFKCSL